MKSQDIFILLKLVSLDQQAKACGGEFIDPLVQVNVSDCYGWVMEEKKTYYKQSLSDAYSNRGLEASTGVSKSEVNASIRRSISVGMAKLDRKTKLPKANVRALLEFIIHGIKYVYPANPSAIVRGIPTAIAAPVLKGKLMSAGEFIHVWPDALGNEKGQSIDPLYRSVPMAVKRDPRLYDFLALVDAIRLGAGRETAFAIKELKNRLRA
jgi:hypothetical protein